MAIDHVLREKKNMWESFVALHWRSRAATLAATSQQQQHQQHQQQPHQHHQQQRQQQIETKRKSAPGDAPRPSRDQRWSYSRPARMDVERLRRLTSLRRRLEITGFPESSPAQGLCAASRESFEEERPIVWHRKRTSAGPDVAKKKLGGGGHF